MDGQDLIDLYAGELGCLGNILISERLAEAADIFARVDRVCQLGRC